MTSTQSTTARAGSVPNKPLPEAAYTFRADDPAAIEFDVFRLDCAVDALKGADLSPYREELARIVANIADLLEPMQ